MTTPTQLYVTTQGPVPEYLTAGKPYAVNETDTDGDHWILDDIGVERIICGKTLRCTSKATWTFCDQHGNPVAAPWESEKKQCKCNMRTALVGDGCEVCNPQLAMELAYQTASDNAAMYRAHAERLAEALSELYEACDGIRDHIYNHDAVMPRAKEALSAYNQAKGV